MVIFAFYHYFWPCDNNVTLSYMKHATYSYQYWTKGTFLLVPVL